MLDWQVLEPVVTGAKPIQVLKSGKLDHSPLRYAGDDQENCTADLQLMRGSAVAHCIRFYWWSRLLSLGSRCSRFDIRFYRTNSDGCRPPQPNSLQFQRHPELLQPTLHRKQTCYLWPDFLRDPSASAVSDKCEKIHWPAAFRITATPRFLEAEPN